MSMRTTTTSPTSSSNHWNQATKTGIFSSENKGWFTPYLYVFFCLLARVWILFPTMEHRPSTSANPGLSATPTLQQLLDSSPRPRQLQSLQPEQQPSPSHPLLPQPPPVRPLQHCPQESSSLTITPVTSKPSVNTTRLPKTPSGLEIIPLPRLQPARTLSSSAPNVSHANKLCAPSALNAKKRRKSNPSVPRSTVPLYPFALPRLPAPLSTAHHFQSALPHLPVPPAPLVQSTFVRQSPIAHPSPIVHQSPIVPQHPSFPTFPTTTTTFTESAINPTISSDHFPTTTFPSTSYQDGHVTSEQTKEAFHQVKTH